MDALLSQGISSVMSPHVTALCRNFTKLRVMLTHEFDYFHPVVYM